MYVFFVFFLNDTATTETYTCRHTLTLPDSLPISRPTVRLTEISLNAAYSPAMVWSELSKISSTVACDTGLRADEPEKITSVSESPRRRLAVLSPITQRTEIGRAHVCTPVHNERLGRRFLPEKKTDNNTLNTAN